MNLRIHGDNILECEHALDLIESTFCLDGEAEVTLDVSSPLWAPIYSIQIDGRLYAKAQLLPGYGRWPADIQKELNRRGAPLREMPDAIVTEVLGEDDEEPIAAFEFCGALPAGNNAWQRCGRALNLAYPRIPFFYFAELGGAELNSSRYVKSSRTPNPLIPFAYIALGDALKTLALPVFEPSPSIQDEERARFGKSFGRQEAVVLLACILGHKLRPGKELALKEKALLAIEILAASRKNQTTVLSAKEWNGLAASATGAAKASWLVQRGMAWRKAINIGKTPTLTKLYEAIKGLAVSVGTQDFAICLIPAAKIDALQSKLRQIYGERITPDFIDSIAHKNRPLVVVSVAGFKPRGDDSRPDRGLLPLARMLFGEEDVNVLSIIYGPAKDPGAVINDPPKAAKTNGLWESIIRFSTAFLLDSTTSLNLKQISAVIPKREEAKPTPKPKLPAGGTNPIRFGEHDVDSALHTIFSRMLENVCFECICNPPGGDWSGFSMQIEDSIYRWTSLPRVTATKEKRPDHAIQFKASRTFFLTIESKDSAGSVEPNIGPRLRQYVKSLLQFSPTICRNSNKCSQWGPFQGELKFTVLNIVTAAAFRLSALEELDGVLSKGKCDIVIGFVFDKEKETTKLHFKANGDFTEIKGALQTAASQSACRLIIHIH